MKKRNADRFPAYLQLVPCKTSKDQQENTDASSVGDDSPERMNASYDLDDDSSDRMDASSKLSVVSSDQTEVQSTVIWEHADRSEAFDESYVMAGAADAPILRIRLISSGFGNGILCQAA